VWKLDRLGRNLHHLVTTVHDLTARGVGLEVLTGEGAAIDTTTPAGKLVFGIFAALAEFEWELISERTVAGLASARARGRKGGPPYDDPGQDTPRGCVVGQPDTAHAGP
jgi:DNA invertase Pin-like site-specific DNA recombinase